MLFNSIHFLIFAPIVVGAYFLLRDSAQRWLLLISSLYFYAVFKVPFTAVLLFSIVVTHYCSLALHRAQGAGLRRTLLWGGILANLSILYFLKYIDFSFEIANQILGHRVGDPEAVKTLGVILPMGISFFTLQAIAYVVDVYRREIEPTPSLFQFALFLSFFPQLVAGPIMRARDLLHQFQEQHKFSWDNVRVGAELILVGFFRKTMVADPAASVVEPIFGAPHEYNWWALALGTFLFVIQIYCDFAGYSDIAIGTGRIMGFRIPINFNRPLLATSIIELWRRWHISLSTWLRDYIYIPLGGSRSSRWRVYFNVGVSMVIGGVWHGAAWTFVCWGLAHTLFIIVERYAFSFPRIAAAYERIPRVFRILYTLLAFTLGAVFFRSQVVPGDPRYAHAMDAALVMFERMFTIAGGKTLSLPAGLAWALGILSLGEMLQEFRPGWIERLKQSRTVLYGTLSVVLLICFFIYSVTTSPQFIYFQF